MKENNSKLLHPYFIGITTELDEMETLNITAVSSSNAKDHAAELVISGLIGLHGRSCATTTVLKFE